MTDPQTAHGCRAERFTPASIPDASARTEAAPIPEHEAVRRAMAHTVGTRADQLLPGVEMVVRFGYFSDDQYCKELPDGTRKYYWQNHPVWLVTFAGPGLVRLPVGGRPPGSTDRTVWQKQLKAHAHHEDNVVIDAVTGEYMMRFSYR